MALSRKDREAIGAKYGVKPAKRDDPIYSEPATIGFVSAFGRPTKKAPKKVKQHSAEKPLKKVDTLEELKGGEPRFTERFEPRYSARLSKRFKKKYTKKK